MDFGFVFDSSEKVPARFGLFAVCQIIQRTWIFLSFLFFTLFNKVEKVHRYNAGKGGDELPIHHGVSVQGHEENLAAAS